MSTIKSFLMSAYEYNGAVPGLTSVNTIKFLPANDLNKFTIPSSLYVLSPSKHITGDLESKSEFNAYVVNMFRVSAAPRDGG